jgi:hypothetical protein
MGCSGRPSSGSCGIDDASADGEGVDDSCPDGVGDSAEHAPSTASNTTVMLNARKR